MGQNDSARLLANVLTDEISRFSAAVDRDAPPVFWTEVWTRSNRQWITVDVSRQAMRCKKAMEPAKGNIENQMIYVCAYEEGRINIIVCY